ncbi:hypothetical protein ATANTOWER_024873 [Ataeniobius toweri]|uniref:Uncharacterized protein n=1 Tax=Ataeniobius toweri TaxID=208326 RepID=A0ABU7AVD4_9TELE|nr:hypothetical protein [Ataeniobius toweri]
MERKKRRERKNQDRQEKATVNCVYMYISYSYSYSSSSTLSGTGSRGQQTQERHPDVPLPRHLLQLLREEPKAFPGQPRDIVPPACPGPSPRMSLLPVGRAWNTSRGRHPGGIRYRCPSHLNWLLSMWRSNGSTPSPSWMAELLTLSLKECPATLQRKLISAACIRDLVLSVMTQSSWP